MTLTLGYIRLLVQDYAACFRFYRDVIGLEATFGDENSGYADFRTGDVSLALFDRGEMMEAVAGTPASSAAEAPDRVALIFQVGNVDESVRFLEGQGVRFVTQPEDRADWGIRTAHFRDPDGTLLEIFSPLQR